MFKLLNLYKVSMKWIDFSVLSFENDKDRKNTQRMFSPKVKKKDYIVMIDGQEFFDQAAETDRRTYYNIRKTATDQKDDCVSSCLFDYPYFKEQMDLRIQLELNADPEKYSKLKQERDGNTRMFFIIEEAKKPL